MECSKPIVFETNSSVIANTGTVDWLPSVPKMSARRPPQEEDCETGESEVAAAAGRNNNRGRVPEEPFSSETNWRSGLWRKQVVCFVLKSVFPELNPGSVNFEDLRLYGVINLCQEAEEEVFDRSSSRAEYEFRVKGAIWRLITDKQASVNRILETSKRKLSTSNRNLTSEMPSPSTSQTSRASESLQSVEVSECNPCVQILNPDVWRHLFAPILNHISELEESKLFQFRNDRESYPVTSYLQDGKAVNRPIDLHGVNDQLMNDVSYLSNPWKFITDVCWVFTIPLCSPRKNLKKQVNAKNLLKRFVEKTDKIMVDRKYCCGRQYFHFPSDLVCVGKVSDCCCIAPYSKYFVFDITWTVCEKCFNHTKDLVIEVKDRRSNEENIIQKCEFEELKNDNVYVEPMVECVNCGRINHKVCVHYLELNSNRYTCDDCLHVRQLSREIQLRASRIPSCVLDSCIESRVTAYLRSHGVYRNVWIRVVSNTERITEVKKGMKELYVEGGDGAYKLCESYPYRQKVIFAFEEIDGKEVAFFAMYVQEYGSDCPPPNTRRVYVAYLDSVHYFQPKEFRTGVYHEILLAYMEHTKELGFTTFHIWACPPSEGNDYIFYAHPPEQKVPKAKRLMDWYKRILDRGHTEGILIDYKDMCQHVIAEKLHSVAQIPYMEGDFWPDCFENIIKLIEEEKSQLGDVNRPPLKKRICRSKSKKPAETALESICENVMNSDALSYRVMSEIYKHKDQFFVVYLNLPSEQLPPIVDPDPLTQPCIMDSRDSLVESAREHLLEYSSERRAVYSTLMLLKECTPGFGDKESVTCNHCGKGIDESIISYTCCKCVEFDLCDSCLRRNSHLHKMTWRGLDIQEATQGQEPLTGQAATVTLRTVAHAVQCEAVDCPQINCHELKSWLFHKQECQDKARGCNHCCQIERLISHHASFCTIPIPLCSVMECGETKLAARFRLHVVEDFKQFNANLLLDATFAQFQESMKSRELSGATNDATSD